MRPRNAPHSLYSNKTRVIVFFPAMNIILILMCLCFVKFSIGAASLLPTLLSARQKSVKASWVSVTGYFRLPRYDGLIVIRMHGATNLKKACPSIWCSRPRLATALAETWKGSSWLGNCLSLSLGTGLRSPCGASGTPRRL